MTCRLQFLAELCPCHRKVDGPLRAGKDPFDIRRISGRIANS
jgi:hypothetical protein